MRRCKVEVKVIRGKDILPVEGVGLIVVAKVAVQSRIWICEEKGRWGRAGANSI